MSNHSFPRPDLKKAILVLSEGSCFKGYSIGAQGMRVGEVVFNTSMTGYQEILTDPSYFQQIVVLTCPHIGNTGTNSEDMESEKIWCSGLVIRDCPDVLSNWRSQQSLSQELKSQGTPGIAGIDTRHLTNILRQKGTQKGCILAADEPNYEKALKAAKKFPGLVNADLAKEVTTSQEYQWQQGSWQLQGGYQTYSQKHLKGHVVVYDFGVKKNMLRLLSDRGYKLTVVPATTKAEQLLKLAPDGVLLSNGPGDPEPCSYAIKAIQQLLTSHIPILGICLGHQLLALASGAQTSKMKFGHHGANHPVKDEQGKVSITSQNHGFTVAEKNLPDSIEVTHRSLFDGTIQGIRHKHFPALGFQGHPEASPGPHDMLGIFADFETLMERSRQ